LTPCGEDWNYDEKLPLRRVTDIRVSEVTVCAFPAYQQTDVFVAQRSLLAFQQTERGNRVEFLARELKNLRARTDPSYRGNRVAFLQKELRNLRAK
jgi:phage head maturation protease